MADLANQPSTVDLLSNLGFRFVIHKLPNVNYFAQTVAIPAVSMAVAETPTPVITIPHPGTKLVFEPLVVRFKVDANLANYLEVFNWLVGLGHPVSFSQTAALAQKAEIPAFRDGKEAGLKSDATLVVLTAHKNPSFNVSFIDLFPVSLSELTFDSTDVDVTYLEATATFRYTRFDITAA